MINIDRQRVAAVRKLEALGYSYQGEEWVPAPAVTQQSLLLTAESDALHGALVRRADALEGCTRGSFDEAELEGIVDVIESYEAVRWPLGKELGGKG